jgi:hypothetical protein
MPIFLSQLNRVPASRSTCLDPRRPAARLATARIPGPEAGYPSSLPGLDGINGPKL